MKDWLCPCVYTTVIHRLIINILFVHYSINNNYHDEYVGVFDRGHFGVCFV